MSALHWQLAELGVWLTLMEQRHGGLRKAAAEYGIDPGNWHRLREGKSWPDTSTLQKLGLEKGPALYRLKVTETT